MTDMQLPDQPRRSSHVGEAEGPDDKAARSSIAKNTITTSQLDGQAKKRDGSLSPLKQADEAMEGKKTAQPDKINGAEKGSSDAQKKADKTNRKNTVQVGQQKPDAHGGTGAGKKNFSKKPNKVADLDTGDLSRGKAHILETSSSKNNTEPNSEGLPSIGISRPDGFGDTYRPGGAFQAVGGMRSLLGSQTKSNYSTTALNQIGSSTRPEVANQSPDGIQTRGYAQSSHGTSNPPSSSASATSQSLGVNNGQAQRFNPARYSASVPNGQRGRWIFDDESPCVPLPSYTFSLPHDQQEAIKYAATSSFGLMHGWIAADQNWNPPGMYRLTMQQRLDVMEAVYNSQKDWPLNPYSYPTNEQAGATSLQARVSNPLRDAVFYEEAISEGDEDEVGSEASYESFDLTPYSLQTCDGGEWYEPKFETTSSGHFENRLIAGVNCPPNVLQQCDLTINPWGRLPYFVPYEPAVQRRQARVNPNAVSTNVEGGNTNSRNMRETYLSQNDPDRSQQPVDTDALARFTALMGQASKARVSKPHDGVICDGHDCDKELGIVHITCARCHQARYCGTFCQVFTWLVHLPTCELHCEANAREVTALEDWATGLWNGAIQAVKDAEEAEPLDAMHIDGEELGTDIAEPHTGDRSASTSFRTSDDVVMDDGDDEYQQNGDSAMWASQSTAPDDLAMLSDDAMHGQKGSNGSASSSQSPLSEDAGPWFDPDADDPTDWLGVGEPPSDPIDLDFWSRWT